MTVPASGSNSYSQNMNSVSNIEKELQNMRSVQLFKDDTGTARVLLGKDGDFNGLKVSQPGQDVTTASLEQLIFTSDNNVFKIVETGTSVVTLPSSFTDWQEYSTTTAHNLGYSPLAIAFMDVSSTILPVPQTTIDSGGNIQAEFGFQVDDTNIKFYIRADSLSVVAQDYSFKYYLLRETAT